MRLFYIILLLITTHIYGLEIVSNYPLPQNNIEEVYNSLDRKEDIVKFLKKTESFLDIKYKNQKLYLLRKPLIKKIIIKGNDSYWDREIKGIAGIYEGKYISQDELSIIPLKLKQFYFDNGFLDAEISVKLTTDMKGNSYININIRENKKYKIKNIKFISDRKISPEIQNKYEKVLNLKNKSFKFSNVQSKIEKLLQRIKKEGYYDAFISIFNLHKLNDKELSLYINIVHGFKYKIKFVGNYSVDKNILLKFSEFEENGVNYYQIQNFAKKIQQFYKSEGFLDASVDYSYKEFLENKKAVITIYIYEGKKYRISKIKIDSDHKIPKSL
ncbi:POTRA domain-containing protein, partial [Hydrogenivirga sp. 128-5-R1-1]|uniref:POTRA domain-containing protein n=1 Tax=Hydrogenivirga sp. 128-5-R1-1 TaxID=392423 RepID=UPI00015F2E8E